MHDKTSHMPRKTRFFRAGEIYHVYARGNGRSTIFHEDAQRLLFLQLLGDILPAHDVRIFAYCLMDNHFHLVLQLGQRPLGRPMQRLLSTYARLHNRQAGRSGHLFERRYQASHVHNDSYAKTLLRYVHFNPVRALIVEDPAAYPWSSHRSYISGPSPHWLDTRPLLRLFGGRVGAARRQFQRFCSGVAAANTRLPDANHDPVAETPDPQDSGAGNVLRPEGPPSWHDLQQLIEATAHTCNLPPAAVLHGRSIRASRARGLIARAIQESESVVLSDFARATGRHLSTLSNAGTRTRRRCLHTPSLQQDYEAIQAILEA